MDKDSVFVPVAPHTTNLKPRGETHVMTVLMAAGLDGPSTDACNTLSWVRKTDAGFTNDGGGNLKTHTLF